MAVINTNYKALFGQVALKATERSLQTAMQQLSTGKRINSAKDDAAGMAIATRMSQQIRSLNQAVRNAGDAVSLIQTVEGATNAITDMMQRMRELAIQAINDTNSNDQRSYLDLEFQQLKQEIVRISDMTEWNGFQVLNGSAGARVGERPVFKATSVNDFDKVFIDPTTARVINGSGAGEVQTLTFSTAPTASGTITLGSATITVSAGDSTADMASSLRAALAATELYGTNSGRTLSVSGSDITIIYAATEGDVSEPTLSVGSTGAEGAVVETSEALTSTTETFVSPGTFLKAGALNFTVASTATASSVVSGTFLSADGISYTIAGTVFPTTGEVVFEATGGNAAIISEQLTYVFKDANGDVADLTGREASLAVDVSGSIAGMKSGDLVINGVYIGASYPVDDKLSPSNNAAGSAIAIAAAINRESDETGVVARVNANTMRGTAMSGAAVVNGDVVINGFTAPRITTILNNTRDSRAATVAAINFISDKTGVIAIDSESDSEGIRLYAEDGRNIEVSFQNLDASGTEFAARTGLRAGVQSGTYSLESRVEQPIRVTTSATGDVGRARMVVGSYESNLSTQATQARAVVADSANIATLKDGDLVINGIEVRATRAADDKFSNTTSLTSSKPGSAIAIAAAINEVAPQTGVTATALGAEVVGDTVTRSSGSGSTGTKSLFVNGVEVLINFDAGTTAAERVDEIVSKVNALTGAHGTLASKTPNGALNLTTTDGRNLAVWFDDTSPVTAADFGLGSDGTTATAGVTGITGASATSTGAATAYGRVSLSSDKQFSVEPGANGYKSESNFSALGFMEGKFGGVVPDADGKMSPPRTGRLAFQVGASAGQLITIDLADFGKGGPITGTLTSDVNDPGTITTRANLTTISPTTTGPQTLYFNGIEIKVEFSTTDTPSIRRQKVIDAVNASKTEHGIQASIKSGENGITLTTFDGRNLSVWFDSEKVGSATEFGLGGADGVTGEPGATATFGGAKVLYPDTNNIRSGTSATAVLQKLDIAMDKVNANRANMGAVMNRLQYAMDTLSNVSMNTSASRSQIEDADYAAASTELAKTQIMQQAATSVLAQANMSQQTVLKLLGG